MKKTLAEVRANIRLEEKINFVRTCAAIRHLVLSNFAAQSFNRAMIQAFWSDSTCAKAKIVQKHLSLSIIFVLLRLGRRNPAQGHTDKERSVVLIL